jgi:hypothetical protein
MVPSGTDGKPVTYDWTPVEAALGAGVLKPELRDRLHQGLDEIASDYPAQSLPHHDTSKWLVRVRKAAEQLCSDLSVSTAGAEGTSARHTLALIFRAEMTGEQFDALLTGLNALIAALDDHPHWLRSAKVGREGDANLRATIWTLGVLYYDMTGKMPGTTTNYRGSGHGYKYGGPFFRFVRAFLAAVAPEDVKSDQSLAKTIQRSLPKKRRTKPTMDKTR